MCGIIGYIGSGEALPVIMEGLEALAYRGYDSAGLTLMEQGVSYTSKTAGRIEMLAQKLEQNPPPPCHTGIGHTRWATHGAATEKNAHPHSKNGVFLVHNGIIENDIPLKREMAQQGVTMVSETDTEVAATAIALAFGETKDPKTAIFSATKRMTGSYAFAVLFEAYPDTIFAICHDSPLVIGIGTERNEMFVASDLPAILGHTRSFIRPADGELCVLTRNNVSFFDRKGNRISHTPETAPWDAAEAALGGYQHYMQKEMAEQPRALTDTLYPYVKNGQPSFAWTGLDKERMRRISEIHIVACGSAMHAGLLGKRMIQLLAHCPVEVEIASEFRYTTQLFRENALVIVISQSGETADSLAALRYSRSRNVPVAAIVNVATSTIAREADILLSTHAGPEIAVATTKGYLVQSALLALFALALAACRETRSETEIRRLTQALLRRTPEMILDMLDSVRDETYAAACAVLQKQTDAFYIGRGLDAMCAMECALKLKEISYLHCEAYAAGEMKHGTISLISEGTVVLAISTEPGLYPKMLSNIREVRSRGAYVILICGADFPDASQVAQQVILLPENDPLFLPLAAVVAGQRIAYETALALGRDVDKPRNLAKSVTVE